MRTLLLLVGLLCNILISNAQIKKAWEVGAGISAYQFNRVNNLQLIVKDDGNTIALRLDHVTYAGQVYVGKELTENGIFTADFQANVGVIDNNWFSDIGAGLQFRFGYLMTKPNSPYIDPYFRVGIAYFQKGKLISYDGMNEGIKWNMKNVNNASGKDAYHMAMITAAMGCNFWINDRVGFNLEGKYGQMIKNQMANTIQGSGRLLFRLGGRGKSYSRPVYTPSKYEPQASHVDREVIKEVVRIDTIYVEKEVEIIRNVMVNDKLASISFSFNSSAIQDHYVDLLNSIAEYMTQDTERRFVIIGYADAKGSSEYNDRLSVLRAESVKKYLISIGVPEKMLKVKGRGSRVHYMPPDETEEIRGYDRQAVIEEVINEYWWNNLR